MSATATIRGVGKKKPIGKGPSPRTAVQIPTVWLQVARSYASKNRQPTLWYLIGLIEKDARERGEVNLPPLPWEEDEKPEAN